MTQAQQYDLKFHLEEFKRDGYTVFEKLIDQSQIDSWKELAEQLRKEELGVVNDKHFYKLNILEHHPQQMLPLTANPIILDFLELVMGPFIQIGDNNLSMFPPQDESYRNKVISWHRDMYGFSPRGTDYQIPRQILALAYLEEMTEDTGPLRVIPGSHRQEIYMTAEERTQPHAQELVCATKPGDVVVFSGLLHTGTYNVSDRYRILMGGMYTYSWYKHNCEFDGPVMQRLIQAATEHNDARMLRLLGNHGPLEKARINSSFTRPEEETWAEWTAEDKKAIKGSADWWRTMTFD